jgi:Fe-S oxidoreductase
LKEFFDYYRIDYTLLSKEYCCGYPLVQPAAAAKNDDEIARAKELSREFIYGNFKQAKELGAKSIVLFCAGCEPNYADLQKETDLEVLSYYELLDRYFTGGVLELAVDYYAGCYRFRRKITQEPVDVEAAYRVLGKIKWIKVNHVDNKLCCFIEPLMEKLVSSLTNKTLITICSGCHATMTSKLKDRDGYQVKMLPEIVMESLKKK